jgi:hypothetical protein
LGKAAHFAPSHGIRLTCEGEGASPWFADLAGGKMQVDDGVILLHTDGALVHAHAPQAQDVAGLSE